MDILAADVGGTNVRIAIVREGLIVDESRHQADFSQLGSLNRQEAEQHILNTIQDAVQPFITANTQGLGIGFPGFFVGHSGVLTASPNIPQLQNFALSKKLTERLNIPVTAQNESLCAAMGEHAFGAGKGHANLLHITLGTGIGGGLILNNLPYTGESGMAMEFGHLRVVHNEDARVCGCGNKGCVEAYASATAISAIYFEATGTQVSVKSIYQRALDGENQAQSVLESAGLYLGAAIAESIKLLDIRTVSISGGLIGAWDMLHPHMVKSLDDNLIPPLKGKINLLPTRLNDNAGILGAAALAK